MRRVMIAFFMLAAAVIGICIITVISDSKMKALDNQITELYNNAESYSEKEINSEINKLLTDWNKTQKFLKFFTVHEKILPLDENIRELEETAKSYDISEIKKQCARIKIILETVYTSEKPFAENIF